MEKLARFCPDCGNTKISVKRNSGTEFEIRRRPPMSVHVQLRFACSRSRGIHIQRRRRIYSARIFLSGGRDVLPRIGPAHLEVDSGAAKTPMGAGNRLRHVEGHFRANNPQHGGRRGFEGRSHPSGAEPSPNIGSKTVLADRRRSSPKSSALVSPSDGSASTWSPGADHSLRPTAGGIKSAELSMRNESPLHPEVARQTFGWA